MHIRDENFAEHIDALMDDLRALVGSAKMRYELLEQCVNEIITDPQDPISATLSDIQQLCSNATDTHEDATLLLQAQAVKASLEIDQAELLATQAALKVESGDNEDEEERDITPEHPDEKPRYSLQERITEALQRKTKEDFLASHMHQQTLHKTPAEKNTTPTPTPTPRTR